MSFDHQHAPDCAATIKTANYQRDDAGAFGSPRGETRPAPLAAVPTRLADTPAVVARNESGPRY
jgi:hypothetical protein